jgi:hypothetical protein
VAVIAAALLVAKGETPLGLDHAGGSFEQFSNTTTGISRFQRSAEETRISQVCSHFAPNRAICFPLLPTLFRLDKAEVVGSSPTSPIEAPGYLDMVAVALSTFCFRGRSSGPDYRK